MHKILLLIILITLQSFGGKRIVVDLSKQAAYAYEDGKILFFGHISSGKPGRETPRGHFRILEKDIDHVSNLWPAPNGGARMPYMLRITRDGVALHLGNTPNYPASHGCIRMQDGFAQKMFFWARKGIPVDVVGTAPAKAPNIAFPSYTSEEERKFYETATQYVREKNPKDRNISPLDILRSGTPPKKKFNSSIAEPAKVKELSIEKTKKFLSENNISKQVVNQKKRTPLDIFR